MPPYHHGNLREELLAAAGEVLRTQGPEQVSLRELARSLGVSHAAPARHFRDRQTLLDALVLEGHETLARRVESAAGAEDPRQGLRAAVETFVGFAGQDPQLWYLMKASAKTGRLPEVDAAAARVYEPLGRLVADLQLEDPARQWRLMAALLQGTAVLATTPGFAPADVEALIDDVVALLLT